MRGGFGSVPRCMAGRWSKAGSCSGLLRCSARRRNELQPRRLNGGTSVVIRLAPDNRERVRMKLQIIRAAVGGMSVVDLPKAIAAVQFDSAPLGEALLAQHGLDGGALLGGVGPVGRRMSRQELGGCY